MPTPASWPKAVYPRVCGGTHKSAPGRLRAQSLSPRMRGNPKGRTDVAHGRRSIPAYAGEPSVPTTPEWVATVYPRVCGGTKSQRRLRKRPTGLSPRMRGNRPRRHRRTDSRRSIPAYAGEPAGAGGGPGPGGVYPRVCGGTLAPVPQQHHPPGLSPRMRGNLALHLLHHHQGRSIPAYAGEPQPCPGVGTKPVRLSPRIRGNSGLS